MRRSVSQPCDLFAVATALRSRRTPFALATVISSKGSCFARPGFKAIFDSDGADVCGWVGGGCAQSAVAHAAIEAIHSGATQAIDVDLNDEVLGAGMPCGGSFRVFVDPVLPPPQAWIMGHGPLAEALCLLCSFIGLDVIVCDAFAKPEDFVEAKRVMTESIEGLKPEANDFVIIAAQHTSDKDVLDRMLASDASYIALLASKHRSKLILDRLLQSGRSQAETTRIRSPAGLDLKAQTPEEVALEVVSEVLLVWRGRANALSIEDQSNTEVGPV